uniref:t-SNARE coiled-coil homology domain-containing protein n=1 Tax=Kalanchoe fedtschenkoi TaxID=63787 RepID=A0A7N0UVC3_KALFE
MSFRRENRGSRSTLFDDIEEGGLRTNSQPRQIDIRDNDKDLDSLHDRVSFLKRLTGDIHEEVETHNRMLDRMGNAMDASRGIMSGTMDRFKKVFEKKSTRRTCVRIIYVVIALLIVIYLIRLIRHFR